MTINTGDYVYIPIRGVYGRVTDNLRDIGGSGYLVTFRDSFRSREIFEESRLVKLEVPDFKEGDIVTGLKGADAYVVTTDKAVMEVLWITEESMRVKILNHETRPDCKCYLYAVNPIWFKLVRPRTNFYRGEKEG